MAASRTGQRWDLAQQRPAWVTGAGCRAQISRFSGLWFDQERLEGHVISNNWKLSQQPINIEEITWTGPQEWNQDWPGCKEVGTAHALTHTHTLSHTWTSYLSTQSRTEVLPSHTALLSGIQIILSWVFVNITLPKYPGLSNFPSDSSQESQSKKFKYRRVSRWPHPQGTAPQLYWHNRLIMLCELKEQVVAICYM